MLYTWVRSWWPRMALLCTFSNAFMQLVPNYGVSKLPESRGDCSSPVIVSGMPRIMMSRSFRMRLGTIHWKVTIILSVMTFQPAHSGLLKHSFPCQRLQLWNGHHVWIKTWVVLRLRTFHLIWRFSAPTSTLIWLPQELFSTPFMWEKGGDRGGALWTTGFIR